MDVRPYLNRVRWRLQSKLRSSDTLDLNGSRITVGTKSAIEVQRIHGFQRDEWMLLEGLMSRIGPEDVFWDIGANIGLYSLFGGQRCPTVAVEADPTEVARLRKNISINQNAAVSTLGIALSDQNGIIGFDTDTGTIRETSSNASFVYVPSVRGDWVLENSNLPSPTVLKIDVEGAERSVVEGFKQTLESIRLILFEYHTLESKAPTTDSSLLDQLKDEGFRLTEAESKSDNERHYWAERA